MQFEERVREEIVQVKVFVQVGEREPSVVDTFGGLIRHHHYVPKAE